MYQLDEIKFFYLLLIIPIIIMVFIYNKYWKSKVIRNNFSIDSLNYLVPEFSKSKDSLKLAVQILVIIFLIIGLVNPKIGTELKTVTREGVDIVFAVDVSKSMLAEDIAPNRIEKSKRIVSLSLIHIWRCRRRLRCRSRWSPYH